MSIRKWHLGKLVIVWVWGGTIAGLVLTDFEANKVESSPWRHLLELVFVVVVAFGLTVMTWIWLGNRKTEEELDS